MTSTFFLIELSFALVGLAALWGHHHRLSSSVRDIAIRLDGCQSPATTFARRGERIRLRFLRASDADCAREVVFPALNIRRALPVGQTVTVELRPPTEGPIEYFCGMHRLRGTVEVRPQV